MTGVSKEMPVPAEAEPPGRLEKAGRGSGNLSLIKPLLEDSEGIATP
jgi:hypothetical protein